MNTPMLMVLKSILLLHLFKVGALPQVEVVNGTNPIIENQLIKLNCSNANTTNAYIEWTISTDKVKNKTVIQNEFMKTNFLRTDAGYYSCKVIDKINKTVIAESATLRIGVYFLDKPELWIYPKSPIMEGKTYGLKCEEEDSYPSAQTVTYMKDNVVLTGSPVRMAMQNETGFYQCMSDNGYIKKYSEPVYLRVESKLNVSLTSSTNNFIIGEPFSLSCVAKSYYPTPSLIFVEKYYWYKNGVMLSNNASILYIVKPTLRDNGNYRCEAKHENIKKTSERIMVEVIMSATLTPAKKEVKVGDTYYLTCVSYTSNPIQDRITYRWYRDDSLLTGYDTYNMIAFQADEESEDNDEETQVKYMCMAMRSNALFATSNYAIITIKPKYEEMKSPLVLALIGGVVFGGIALIVLIVCCCVYCCCRRHLKTVEVESKQPYFEEKKPVKSKFSNISAKTVRMSYSSQMSDAPSIRFEDTLNSMPPEVIPEEGEEGEDSYEELEPIVDDPTNSMNNHQPSLTIKPRNEIIASYRLKDKPRGGLPVFTNDHDDVRHTVSDVSNVSSHDAFQLDTGDKMKANRVHSDVSNLSFKPIKGPVPSFNPDSLNDTESEIDEDIVTEQEAYPQMMDNTDETQLLASETEDEEDTDYATKGDTDHNPDDSDKNHSDDDDNHSNDNDPKQHSDEDDENYSYRRASFYENLSDFQKPMFFAPPKSALPDLPMIDIGSEGEEEHVNNNNNNKNNKNNDNKFVVNGDVHRHNKGFSNKSFDRD